MMGQLNNETRSDIENGVVLSKSQNFSDNKTPGSQLNSAKSEIKIISKNNNSAVVK